MLAPVTVAAPVEADEDVRSVHAVVNRLATSASGNVLWPLSRIPLVLRKAVAEIMARMLLRRNM